MKKFKKNQSAQHYQPMAFVLAIVAGMVNLSAFFLLYSFASNITGYFAMFAEEASSRKWFQAFVVLAWIALFFAGNALSALITHLKSFNRNLFVNILPLLIIVVLLVSVALFGNYYYDESIQETELLLGVLLFAMGCQNGFSASISNLMVKNTHLTGATTDLAVLITSKIVMREGEVNPALMQRLKLVSLTVVGYMLGAILGGLCVRYFGFWTLALAALLLFSSTLVYVLYPYLINFKFRVLSKSNNYLEI